MDTRWPYGLGTLILYSKPDDVGFDKEEIAKVELFNNKPFDIPNFPKNEQIK